jgi:hypothetical protein
MRVHERIKANERGNTSRACRCGFPPRSQTPFGNGIVGAIPLLPLEFGNEGKALGAFPFNGLTRGMKDGNNDNRLVRWKIEDGIGKAPDDGLSNISVRDREYFGMAAD